MMVNNVALEQLEEVSKELRVGSFNNYFVAVLE